MNLAINPWIPVLDACGARRLTSLADVFASAHEIRDLAVKPHEKIALLRLLICISQAALDGPEEPLGWERCRDRIQDDAKTYLHKWEDQFELFGDGPRFLQIAGLKPGKEEGEGNPATKLDLALASGNNASLFDNAAGSDRPVTPARMALTLLTFQCFAPGGRIGVAKWNGADTEGKGSSNHAPCTPSGMLHTFLQGASLLETLHLNLLSKTDVDALPGAGWGQPIWECPVQSATNRAGIANATMTYLGRLVPSSRAVRLEAGGRHIVLANGFDYPIYPQYREPAATIRQGKDGPKVLGVALDRSVWRQLSAITVKRKAGKDDLSGPAALLNLGDNRGATLWIGALATDKAKIEDVVESSYDVPASMFRDTGRRLYERGIELADAWQNALWGSIKTYAATLKLEPPPYDRGRQFFWTAVEQHVPELLRLAGAPETAGELKTSPWGNAVRAAAMDAFDHACPHQTPRQIEAFARGCQQLFLPKPKDPNAPAAVTSKKSLRPVTA